MTQHVHRVLDRIAVLRNPCDLDLLLFFVRHSRALLAGDQIAAFLGYHVTQVSASLDVLVTAGLLTRTHKPTGAAPMFVLATGGRDAGLASLAELASTRQGRRVLHDALRSRAQEEKRDPEGRPDADAIADQD